MDSTRLQEGMTVYSAQGKELGKVVRRDAQTFVVEKGVLLHKEYVARYEDVAEVSGGEVRLARGEEALGLLARGASAEGPLGEAGPTGAGSGAETIPTTPIAAEPEARAARDEDEAGATVTYGMGEDSGATHARRDDPERDTT